MEDDMRSRFITIFVVMVATAGLSLAQPAPAAPDPGAVAIEDLGAFAADGASIDVDLQGPMVQLIAAAAAEDDPEVAELLRGIRRIRVLSGAPGEDWPQMLDRFETAARTLESRGWTRVVRVRDEDELVLVLVMQSGDRFAGLTVLMVEAGDEAALVNIAGDIDPATIGRLSAVLDDVPDLDDLTGADR
jgi:hypothetical protein